MLRLGIHRHYKGNTYLITSLARGVETRSYLSRALWRSQNLGEISELG